LTKQQKEEEEVMFSGGFGGFNFGFGGAGHGNR